MSALALALGLQTMLLGVVAMKARGFGFTPNGVEAGTMLFQLGLLAAGALPAIPSLLRSEPRRRGTIGGGGSPWATWSSGS